MRKLFVYLLSLVMRPLLRRTATGPPRRVLLIKPDHLGDVLLATPAIFDLRRRFPDAEIIALVGPWSRVMLRDNPDVDVVLDLPFPGFERRPRTRRLAELLLPYLLLLRYAILLRPLRCDAALILRDDHWWGAALALLAGIPQRIGYDLPLCRPLLSQALPIQPGSHVGQQALDLVAALAVAPPPGEPPALQFTPTAGDQAWATGWLANHLAPGDQLIVLHPGTGGPGKHWLPARWAAVADELAQPGRRVLLTGGPAEAELLQEVAGAMQTTPLILAGELSIGRLAALLSRAALVMGVDSGPLHIAVSQGAPSLHLFGPSDPARFGPWVSPERHVVLRAGTWCSPCGVFAACPRGTDPPECMAQIEVAAVLRAARSLLATP